MTKPFVVRLLTLIALFWALTRIHVSIVPSLGIALPLDVSIAQIIAFPIVIFWLFSFRLQQFRVPRSLLLVALAGGLIGAGIAYGPPSKGAGTFLIARLQEDRFESDSSVFREKVNESVGRFGVKAVRHFEAFQSASQVKEFIRQGSGSRPVVWGNQRWINISFPAEPLDPKAEQAAQRVRDMIGLDLVHYVPIIGLSYYPIHDTSKFIGKILLGLLSHYGHGKSDLIREEKILYLDEASRIVARWSALSHRAFPLFVTGTFQIYSAVANESLDRSIGKFIEIPNADQIYRIAQEFICYLIRPALSRKGTKKLIGDCFIV